MRDTPLDLSKFFATPQGDALFVKRSEIASFRRPGKAAFGPFLQGRTSVIEDDRSNREIYIAIFENDRLRQSIGEDGGFLRVIRLNSELIDGIRFHEPRNQVTLIVQH
jgi:hypothetical protein